MTVLLPSITEGIFLFLVALSKMHERLYTVRNVDVALYPEQEEQEQEQWRRGYQRRYRRSK